MHGIIWYIVGFGVILAVLSFLYIRMKLRVSLRLQAQLQREFVALQQEKKVIYDFLHDLGEAFTEEIDREHLLRIIVTCARKVTGAKGAAIYLWDADREKLAAAIVTGTFPPVLKVDNIVADQLAARPENLEAFLRLEALPADSTSVIGEVARSGAKSIADRDLYGRPPSLPAGATRGPGPGQP
jgi:sigma-B regulation protein RsbU (phosphoserine phosphatase)